MSEKIAEHKSTFWCQTCTPDTSAGAGLEMTSKEAMEHLRAVHGLTGEKIPGKREGLSFIDGQGFYANTFKWTFGSVILIQVSEGPA